MSDEKHWPLTIYRVRPDVKRNEIIDENFGSGTQISLGGTRATFFSRATATHTPPWVSFFEGRFDTHRLKINSAGAALLLPVGDRTFVITFGTGRHLLRDDVCEENFGLRTTLNAVDPKRIKTIDRKSLDALGRHTKEQAAVESSFPEFGMNIEQDLLRAVTGKPREEDLGGWFAGSDALACMAPVTLKSLPTYLKRIHALADETTYQKDFGFVDHLREVKRGLKDELDGVLLKKIQQDELDQIWLAVPRIIAWEEIRGFSYSTTTAASEHGDVHLQTYLTERRPDRSSLSLAHLRTDKVIAHRAVDATLYDTWTIYHCLNAEIAHAGATYLLSNRTWYRADPDFVTTVKETVRNIPISSRVFPPYEHASEAAYNDALAKAEPSSLTLIDKKLLGHGGGRSRIEFCDVFSKERELIHIKRYAGSSPLSHLFNQGLVAGELLVSDEQFRAKAASLLPPSQRFPATGLKPAEFEILYGIVSASAKPLVLPFFSEVVLRNTYNRLRGFGLRVSMAKISNPGGR